MCSLVQNMLGATGTSESGETAALRCYRATGIGPSVVGSLEHFRQAGEFLLCCVLLSPFSCLEAQPRKDHYPWAAVN